MEACSYHRNQTGSWRCEGCSRRFCGQCVPGGEDNFRPGQPRCPLCSERLQWQGDGKPGIPFWHRSRDILRYPLKPPALWLVLLLALGSCIPLGLVTGLLVLLLWLCLSVYSLVVIAEVARDDWTPPSPMDVMSEGNLLLKQVALIIVLFGAPLWVVSKSLVLGMGLFALAGLLLPATLMLLAVSRSLILALNPLRWLQLVMTVGFSYLLLWLAVMTVTAAPSLLHIESQHPLVLFLGTGLSVYTSLVASAMMGALLNEKARALGLADDEPRGKSLPAQDYEVAESLGTAHIYAQEGQLDNALKVINRGLQSAPLHQELNWRRLRLLKLLNKDQPWQEQLARFLRQQLSNNNAGSAVSLWLEAQQQQPGFRFAEEPGLSLSLARALYERGRLSEARHLLVNLHQRAPQFKELGHAYVLLARLYLEELQDLMRAEKLLQFVGARFPDAAQSDEAMQTRELLARLSQSPLVG